MMNSNADVFILKISSNFHFVANCDARMAKFFHSILPMSEKILLIQCQAIFFRSKEESVKVFLLNKINSSKILIYDLMK